MASKHSGKKDSTADILNGLIREALVLKTEVENSDPNQKGAILKESRYIDRVENLALTVLDAIREKKAVVTRDQREKIKDLINDVVVTFELAGSTLLNLTMSWEMLEGRKNITTSSRHYLQRLLEEEEDERGHNNIAIYPLSPEECMEILEKIKNKFKSEESMNDDVAFAISDDLALIHVNLILNPTWSNKEIKEVQKDLSEIQSVIQLWPTDKAEGRQYMEKCLKKLSEHVKILLTLFC